jgi:hypothetical protein
MRMDVETFHRHSQFGIALSEKEQSSLARFLNSSKSESTSCLELLQAISKTGVRIEQEVLTNTVSGEGQASNLN